MAAEIERVPARAPRAALRFAATVLVAVAALGALAASGRAQAFGNNRAHASLFVREEGSAGDDVRVAVQIQVDPGFHVGHGPTQDDVGGPNAPGMATTLTLIGDGFEWSAARFPEPEREEVDYLTPKTWLNVHFGAPVIWLRGKKTSAAADVAALEVKINGQTCDPSGCVPYGETVKNSGRGSDKLFAKFPADLVVGAVDAGAAADPGPAMGGGDPIAAPVDPVGGASHAAAPAPTPTKPPAELGLWAFLATAFGWGIFSLLMPCTYPMIPITISYFTKQAQKSHASLLPLSLCYGAGIVLIYVVIGVAVGPIIIPFATHWVTNLIIGAFFLLFALSLFGLILLQPPQFLMQAAGQATRRGGYLGVFLMGATLVITSFTCTAPFVGSLLAAGASSGNLVRVSLGMGVFGLTMAVPFVMLSLLPGKVKQLPKAGEWGHTLKVTLGFVEVAAALKFISNVDLVLQWHVLSRELFLLSWAGIFLLAALYLFGVIRLKEDREPVAIEPGVPVDLHQGVGPGRLVAGLCFFLFSLYNLHGALGNELDWIMKAMAPPYSARVAWAEHGGGAVESGPEIVVDDYDAALARAKEQGKLLLVNFTGFT